MDASLLAPCNIYCGNCVIYRKNKCLGCRRETEIAEARGKVFCDIFSCADSRQLVTCSDCATYLCEKYDESIFAENFIKWMREKLKESWRVPYLKALKSPRHSQIADAISQRFRKKTPTPEERPIFRETWRRDAYICKSCTMGSRKHHNCMHYWKPTSYEEQILMRKRAHDLIKPTC